MFRPRNLHGVPLSSFFPAKFQHPGLEGRKGETDLPTPPPGPAQHRKPHESPLRLAKYVKKLGPCGSAQAQRSFYDVWLPVSIQNHCRPSGVFGSPPSLSGNLPRDLALGEAMAMARLWVECRSLGCSRVHTHMHVCLRMRVQTCSTPSLGMGQTPVAQVLEEMCPLFQCFWDNGLAIFKICDPRKR